jgi:hypothetical protein
VNPTEDGFIYRRSLFVQSVLFRFDPGGPVYDNHKNGKK